MLGNETIIEQLRRQADAGSLSHAYLITGEKGMGKHTLAQLLCLELFCRRREQQGGRACMVCPECRKILSGNHPDVLTLVQEKPNLISVHEIRTQVCDAALIRPYEGGRKVILIPDAQKMNPQAQNALLKTLEEPPEYLMLILLCTDEKMLLDTVLSRCVRLRPERQPLEKIRAFLETDCGADPETAASVAAFAAGNPGKAEAFVRDGSFRELYRRAVSLCREIRTMDACALGRAAKEAAELAEELPEFLELLELWYRDAAVLRASGRADILFYAGEQGALRALASRLEPEQAAQIEAAVEEAARRLRANVNKELTLELLFLKMREFS